jgi:hypothetical protein
VTLFRTETGPTAAFFRRRYGLSIRTTIRHKAAPVTAIMLMELLLDAAILGAWQGLSLAFLAQAIIAGLAAWIVVVGCLWCFGWRVSQGEHLDDLIVVASFVAAVVPVVAVIMGARAHHLLSRKVRR